MPKILITGGCGFIGKATANFFSQKGFDVLTYDIIKPQEQAGTHIFGTIMYLDELYQAMRGCDYVIHLAAALGVGRTEVNRMECLNVNINGTKNVFDASVYAGVKKVIFASSSEVYGDPKKNPIEETDLVCPKSVYAVSKLVGEEYAKAYKQQYGLNYSVIRFFNVYGPYQVAEFVMPRFINSVLKGEAPTVYGDGNQIRCFCHVNDAAQGVYLALTNDQSNGEIFNIGNDRTDINMKDLAEKVIVLAGKNLKPQFVPFDKSDRSVEREVVKRVASIAKASRILGYQPAIDLDTGIRDVMENGGIRDRWMDLKNKYNLA